MRTEQPGADYGKQVKKRLIDLGMTQKELAAELGVGCQYMCRILNGDRSGRKYRKDIDRILDL